MAQGNSEEGFGQALKSFWTTELGDRKARERWLEWLVILAVVIGIIYASGSSIDMVNGRLKTVDESVKLLQTSSQCVPAQTADPTVARLATLTCLEQESVRNRYVFTTLTVQSKIWTRYYACVAGFLLISVGSIFIIMKVRESQNELAAGAKGINLSFKSASPGLAMTLLGTAILVASILTPGESTTTDTAAYISEAFGQPKNIDEIQKAADDATENLPVPKKSTMPSKPATPK